MTDVDASATHRTPPLAVSFMRLGKLTLFEIWLGPVIALSAALGGGAPAARSVVLCGLFLLAIAFGMGATHALDDITGFRDGSDARNYAPERRRSQVKPLVRADLTVAQARTFALATGALAMGCVLAFCLVADFRPWWIFLAGVAVVALGTQYSAGINFSYRLVGGGEALTGITLAASVLVPYAAATQDVTAAAVVQSLLFGLWLVQVLMCSNSRDAEDDRRVERRTIAACTRVRGNKMAVGLVFVAAWALPILAVVTGAMRWHVLVALLPCTGVQVYVLWSGFHNVWRHRKNLGFQAVRLGVVGLVISHVL